MKIFNKTYLLKHSKIKTIRMIDFIYRQLWSKLNDEFDLITVSPPLFDKINAPSLLELDGVNRPINIDFIEEYQIITFYQSLSRWAQKSIIDYGIKIGEGIIFQDNSVWRDIATNSKVSQHKSYIHIELRVDPQASKVKKLTSITNQIYYLIHEISNELNDKYQIENIYPKNIEFVETQLLENEFANLSSYDKEAEIVQELNAFILMQPGKQLLSGITHSKRSNLTYDNDNYNEIHLLDENDGTSINVASIAYKLYGKNLEKIVKQKIDIRVEENQILNEFIKNKTLETIEIKINLFKLYLILLKKGHIAEVQPKVLSKEVVQLKNKHMIEPI